MAVATAMSDDDGRRLTADRRVLPAFWLVLATAADTEAEGGHRTANVPRPETLASSQLTQLALITGPLAWIEVGGL